MGDRNDMTVTRNEWYNTEQEAIAALKRGENIEVVHSNTHLDMFWLRTMQEKLAREGKIQTAGVLRRAR